MTTAQPALAPDPVAAAMIAAGWSDVQIGAAFRAAYHTTIGPATVQQSHLHSVATGAGNPRLRANDSPLARLRAEDSALARLRAAVAGHENLSRIAARIGAAILDRFDENTGLSICGVTHLSMIAQCHRASVFRALDALEAEGIVQRLSYAGIAHCNAYRPLFDGAGMGGIVEKTGNSRMDATVEPESARNSRTNATQSKKIYNNLHFKRLDTAATDSRKPSRRPKFDIRQTNLMLPIAGGKAKAIAAGEDRRTGQVQALFARLLDSTRGKPYQEAVLAIYLGDPALQDRAVKAESRIKGGGLTVVLTAMQQPMQSGTGPP